MNDYKELLEKLRMAGRWIKHDDGSEETYLLSVADCGEAADAIEQLVKERDAAVKDLKNCAMLSLNECLYCKNRITDEYGCCAHDEGCGELSQNWEWRGVQEWRGVEPSES